MIVRIPAELIARQPAAILPTLAPVERQVPVLASAPSIVGEAAAASVVPLVKRVPGASVVESGQPVLPHLPDRPTPEQVRSSLSGLQRGVAQAREEEQR